MEAQTGGRRCVACPHACVVLHSAAETSPRPFAPPASSSVAPSHLWQGGDFTKNNGKGGESIFDNGESSSFDDESFSLKHSGIGVLSMANAGRPNTNRSQFFFCLAKCEWLDGKHVVFGHVTKGLDILKAIELIAGSKDGAPKRRVFISDCGVIDDAEREKEAMRAKEEREAGGDAHGHLSRKPSVTTLAAGAPA